MSVKFLWKYLLCLALTACYEGKVDPPLSDSGDPGDDDTTDQGDDGDATDAGDEDCDKAFSFTAEIASISKEKCDTCHPSLSPPDTTTAAGWEDDIKDIIDRLEGRGALMPQGGPALPGDQIAGIKLWARCNFP